MPTDLTSTNYETHVNDKSNFILDFHATWCKPCLRMKPHFEKAESFVKSIGLDLKFLACDVDEAGDIAEKYNVEKMPTVLLYKDGKEVSKRIGEFKNDEQILTFIGAHFDVNVKKKEDVKDENDVKQEENDNVKELDDGRVGYDRDDDDENDDE